MTAVQLPSTPRVSVVIPLYGAERTIAATLRSVLAQTFGDFEVLVIDDGSRDAGPAIARAFADRRIRVVTQENRGLAGARNRGVCEARGDYIALLDADDLWHPDKLAEHVAALDADAGIGVTYSASRLIDDAGRPLGLEQWPQRMTTEPADIVCRNPIGNGSAPVIRRAAFDAIAFWDADRDRVCWFDESFRQSEDIECWSRMAATTAWRFRLVPRVLTDYRISADGLSANTDRQLATWRRFRAKLASYAPALAARVADEAEAYQLRYLARRAVRGGDGRAALALMRSSLALSRAPLLQEPLRTLATAGAAIALAVVPKRLGVTLMQAAERLASAKA